MRFWWADVPKICIENPIPSRVFCLPQFWERMYPGYTLHYCEPIITGNNTRHLIVRLYRKETGMQQNRRNRP